MRLPDMIRLLQAVLKSDNQVLTISETWILTRFSQRRLNLLMDYPKWLFERLFGEAYG